jgi:SAM-dependent methyltransferase
MPQCPICNINSEVKYCTASDVEYFTSQQSFNFFECITCDILFIDPMPVNQLASIYPPNYYSFTSKQSSLAFKIKDWLDTIFYKKILKKLPGSSLSVLDIGGGTGTLLDTIKKADHRIRNTQVVDIDDKAKLIAESNGHKYYCGTIESFKGQHSFDVILMLNLVEHVSDPKEVLHKAGTLLSPGVVIIIKTPNFKSWDAKLFKNTYWGGLHCPRHWVLFSKKSFISIANTANLKIKYFSYTQGAPFWAFSILHWMHGHRWIKADKKYPIIYHPFFTIISLCAAVVDFIRKPFAPLSQMFFVLEKKKD